MKDDPIGVMLLIACLIVGVSGIVASGMGLYGCLFPSILCLVVFAIYRKRL